MKERLHRRWTSKLSDHLDGDLEAAERAAVEAHLDHCSVCRSVLGDLRAVVGAAREMGGLTPPADLWPGIEAAIRDSAPGHEPEATLRGGDEPMRGDKVIALPTAGRRYQRARRRAFALTAPQLAAAAVVLVTLSVTATRWVGVGTPASDAPVAAEEASSPLGLVSQAPAPPPGLADELSMLEEELAAAREVLDPNTLRVLERNMAVIERAIEDSRQALAVDPGNEFLSRHLQQVYERKLVYLREATALADWAG